jgi:hypothetical protein
MRNLFYDYRIRNHIFVSVFFFILFLMISCSKQNKKSSPSGPPFPDLHPGTDEFADGRYFFNPPVSFYKKVQIGEVLIQKGSKHSPARFYLSIAGIDIDENFRIRSYEGTVHRTNNILDLRAIKCYIFGKKNIDERLVPIERWDCDHLIFSFTIEDKNLRWASSPYTEFSEWSGPFDLKPIPAHAFFAAQVLLNLADGSIIAFAKDASKKLNPEHTLLLYPEGSTLRTIKRYGDFIICMPRKKDIMIPQGSIIYSTTPKKIKGLFED